MILIVIHVHVVTNRKINKETVIMPIPVVVEIKEPDSHCTDRDLISDLDVDGKLAGECLGLDGSI